MTGEIIIPIGTVIAIATFSASMWFLHCNRRTLDQRLRIIHSWRHGAYWESCMEFKSVSYSSHLWSLFFFRNPMKLYGPLTQKAMGVVAP